MILASGFLACFVYCFAIGTLWPGSSAYGRWLAWASTVAKALWISWLVAVTSYLFRVNNPLPFFILLLSISSLIRLFNPPDLYLPSVLHGRVKYLVDLFVVASLVWLTFKAISLIPTPLGLFTEWDAVVSWNRWAIEWATSTYNPATAAYPILFPGIWSLIYRAQDTSEIWFTAKISLYIVPFICILILASLAEQGFLKTAIFTTFGFILMVCNFREATVSGYMDAPVALMMLASGLWMILITIKPSSSDCLWPLSALVGVTAITKQSGLLMFIPYLLVLIVQIRETKAGWKLALKQLAVALIPMMTFMAIYFAREPSPIGNLSLLSNIAANSAKHNSSILHAFNLLFSGWHWVTLLPLLSMSLLNIFRPGKAPSLIGAAFLVLFICFFPVYAKCCSYDVRNGWWLISLLLLSAVCGVIGLELNHKIHDISSTRPSLSIRSRWGIVLLITILIALAGYWAPNKQLLSLQNDLQWNVGYPSISALIRKHRHLITADTKLVTTYMPTRWLPGLEDSYVWCQNRLNDVAECVYSNIDAHRSFILKRELDYMFLDQSIKENYLLDQVDGFQLYGPLEPS